MSGKSYIMILVMNDQSYKSLSGDRYARAKAMLLADESEIWTYFSNCAFTASAKQARWLGLDDAHGDDIASDSIEKFIEKLRGDSIDRNPLAYLIGIIKNNSINLWNQEGREPLTGYLGEFNVIEESVRETVAQNEVFRNMKKSIGVFVKDLYKMMKGDFGRINHSFTLIGMFDARIKETPTSVFLQAFGVSNATATNIRNRLKGYLSTSPLENYYQGPSDKLSRELINAWRAREPLCQSNGLPAKTSILDEYHDDYDSLVKLHKADNEHCLYCNSFDSRADFAKVKKIREIAGASLAKWGD